MVKRIITSIVAICVLVPVLIFSGTPVLPIAVGLATAIGIFEMLKCLGMHKKYVLAVPLYAVALGMPSFIRYSDINIGAACFIIAVAYLIVVFAAIVWSHGKLKFADGMATFIVCAYIIAAMNSIIYVRDFSDYGKYLYLLIFLGAWITDTFAYFTGMLFGKHKLIEDVSPKKTIEGSIGGIFFCVVSFVVFGIIMDVFFDRSANILFLAISSVAVSVVSQIGDLIMSVIKRHYGIKDYGKIFPGHGGVMDRFDSIIAIAPVLMLACSHPDIFSLLM